MKFSIITPTHNFKYIRELYETIVAQTYTDWEWIVYVNGKAIHDKLPDVILTDNRVKVYKDKTKNTKIGYLKHEAFNLGTGDVLIEMDHDDLLLPNCLQRLYDTYSTNPDVGFVSSDDARLQTNSEFVPFSPVFGWRHYNLKYKDTDLIVMDGFDIDAATMAFIWYAPDHVRTWKSDVYKSLGGHNIDMKVLDDHELMIRTYLVTKCHHLHEPLYVYRIDGNNTYTEPETYNGIQRDTVQLFYKYGYQLAERDAELRGLLKVDIGGGIDGKPGYLTIDQEGGQITADLNDGIPLPDNSVGVLNASHILEHLHDKTKIMSEIYRVLADGGWAMIDVPSTDGRGAFQDPTHVSYWNQNSFFYYTRQDQARFIRNTTIRFQEFRLETIFPSQWWQDNNIPVTVAWLRAIKSDTRRAHHKLI